jgi:hypothetical protein
VPTSPWRRLGVPDALRTYTALLGIVQLPSIRMLPTFLANGVRIELQLRRTPGVIGYRTRFELGKLRFYHISAWLDRAAIQRFIREQPHGRAMKTLYGRLGITMFRYWDVPGSDLPLVFGHEMLRLIDAQSEDS